MKRMLVLFAVLAIAASAAQAQELLSNANLNSTVQVGDPALYYPEFVDWTFVTNPCSYSPCPITPYVPGQFYTQYSGYPAGFADRLNPGTGNGFVGTSFEGYYPFEIVGAVDIDVQQEVPATPGEIYRMTGWAHFEGGYAGGVEFLDLLSPNQRNQDAQVANPGVPVASLTDTFFALEFLDNLGNVLPESVEFELHDDLGQQNDNELDGRTWIQHTLIGRAPANAFSVRVRGSMVDGEFNVDAPHQSVFFDDFSLTVIPEPTTGMLALMGLVAACGRRRVC